MEPVVVISGAASGIGLTTAKRFLDDGARVIGIDRSQSDDFLSLQDDFPDRLCLIQADLTSSDDLATLPTRLRSISDKVNVLVNCAGVIRKFTLSDFDEQAWDLVHSVNVKALIKLTSILLPFIKAAEFGRIINISSMTARIGLYEYSAYGSSKAAVSNLTKVWALELADESITVNAICPGWVETPMFATGLVDKLARERSWTHSQATQFALSYVPQQRLIDPAEVAHLVAFLSSPYSGGISGQEIGIDAGLTETFAPNFHR